jgi:hypothetical protein
MRAIRPLPDFIFASAYVADHCLSPPSVG